MERPRPILHSAIESLPRHNPRRDPGGGCMSVAIDQIERLERSHHDQLFGGMEAKEQSIMQNCLQFTRHLWLGSVDGDIACIWGLIPPTLLSTQAYLWLYTTVLVKDHTFLFVRYSQRAVEEMLKEYPVIVGHCIVGNDQAVRWLKWLGAEFDVPDGKKIPFTILRKPNG